MQSFPHSPQFSSSLSKSTHCETTNQPRSQHPQWGALTSYADPLPRAQAVSPTSQYCANARFALSFACLTLDRARAVGGSTIAWQVPPKKSFPPGTHSVPAGEEVRKWRRAERVGLAFSAPCLFEGEETAVGTDDCVRGVSLVRDLGKDCKYRSVGRSLSGGHSRILRVGLTFVKTCSEEKKDWTHARGRSGLRPGRWGRRFRLPQETGRHRRDRSSRKRTPS